MGLCGSKDNEGQQPKKSGKKDKKLTWPKEAPRDPAFRWSYQNAALPKRALNKDVDASQYRAKNLTGEVFVRPPGAINGQQIQVDGCKDCDIFLCDDADSVIIDDCTNCRFFIGPCSGSVFIRTSKNCQMVVACQQLRTRDCSDLKLLLYCASKPVIESSKRIGFGCFDYFYFALQEQFDRCRLSVFNNRWSEIHDFTPDANNLSWIDQGVRAADLLKPLHVVLPENFTSEEALNEAGHQVVPPTWGNKPLPTAMQEMAFALFLPGESEKCKAALKAVSQNPRVLLARTREALLSVDEARTLFSLSTPSPQFVAFLRGPVIGIGIAGASAVEVTLGLLPQADSAAPAYVPATPAEARHMYDTFFGIESE